MPKQPSTLINRASVMALWATVVAERAGFGPDEALSLGQSVAILNARSKGKRLGLVDDSDPENKDRVKTFLVEVCGRRVPAVKTRAGRAGHSTSERSKPDRAPAQRVTRPVPDD